MKRSETLWSAGAAPDAQMLVYTVADDREVDARLLRWDVLGSLGHLEALAQGKIITSRERGALRRALLAALKAVDQGELRIAPQHEDGHSAVEFWLTAHFGDAGERLHAGRSRNDQVATDVRLFLKEEVLALHQLMLALAGQLLVFAARHRKVLWPGYTHQRRAMPSSGGLWAAGLAEGVLTSVEMLPALWVRIDRSPLGSAAGYGLPLPLKREAAMRALGFGGLDQVVTSVQLGRGKHEAAVLAWCVDVGHELSRCAADVILFSAEEFGLLVLPPELGTGSSIMPHKRNPDLFELTRARAAAVEGDLAAVLHLKGKLAGGYHRDFQLLKEPLFRGLDRTGEMLAMLAHAVPKLQVGRERGLALLRGEALVTDEVMRRVERGVAFRRAYRDVAAEFKDGVIFPVPTVADLMRRRRSTGNLGNLGLPVLRDQVRTARRWNRHERDRFDHAMARLAGRPR